GQSGVDCDAFCLCEIEPAGTVSDNDCTSIDSPLEECQCLDEPGVDGYCYIDKRAGIGNPKLVDDCEETKTQALRIVGTDQHPTPRNGATVVMACLGAPI